MALLVVAVAGLGSHSPVVVINDVAGAGVVLVGNGAAAG